MKNKTKILTVLVIGIFVIGITGAIMNEHAKSAKEDKQKENKKPKYNLPETEVIVYLPDETGGTTDENLVKASEVTGLSVEDLKKLKHLGICHNEKQCMEMEVDMTETCIETEDNIDELEEVEDNPYGNPKPKGKAFGVKNVNKTKEQ